MSNSRRTFLKLLTAAGATALAPKAAKGHEYFQGYPGSNAVLHDTTLCIGCRKCEVACNEVNDLPAPDRPGSPLILMDRGREPPGPPVGAP